MYAVKAARPEIITVLANTFSVRDKDNMGRTPLMHAARLGSSPAAAALIPLGAFEEKDNAGRTAMDWAMEKNNSQHFAVVRLFRETFPEAAAAPRVRRGI